MEEVENNYAIEGPYVSPLKEGMGRNISYHRDIYGKPQEKILARRGKDDCPNNYNSKNKVRKLTDRRIVQKNYGRRLSNLIN